ncbi:tripartite tricarboxylate transporter substrate binding protein [Pseudorhodoplanes sp.]|uniref:Bug family tripartite tricarboxylate transporter substrate binding protein n=1 Tax=Pseudorhodoplanes sp. TaxID=1934341 RepID=UPI002C5DBC71|nr:tripartite tricarboxylate transporter substrate binding protein [Pseudorhodoplanes sp.]HWV52879.1 tripartite tricarboxylate transporter substrate binding protein [Pseudorhodoplanes sp.]
MLKHSMAAIAAVFALTILAPTAPAQDFPKGPVTIVVPYPAGGATDFVARLVQPKLSESLGQPVVIENRPGASGNTATAAVMRGKPDGQTIVLTTNAVMALAPHISPDLGFDPLTQAAPITQTSQSGLLLAINPSIPANNVQEFIAYAAKNPGKVTFGTGGAPMQIIGELMAKRGNVDIQHIPYKGAAPAISDAVGGHISAVIMQIASITPFIQSKSLRPLAVTTTEPIKTMPDVPTLTSIYPGLQGINWYGFFAPAGTPKPVIDKLNAGIVAALKDPAAVEKLGKAGEQIVAGTPEELAQMMRQDHARWGEFLKQLPGLKLQ